MNWFQYDGTGSATDPLNYYIVATLPACPGTGKVCVINANIQFIGGVMRPIITSALQTQITFALLTSTDFATVLLRN